MYMSICIHVYMYLCIYVCIYIGCSATHTRGSSVKPTMGAKPSMPTHLSGISCACIGSGAWLFTSVCHLVIVTEVS